MMTRVMAIVVSMIIVSIVMGVKAEAGAGIDTLVLRDTGQTYKPYTYLDVLEDSTGNLTLTDVQRPEIEGRFQDNRDSVPNFGYMAPVHWVRLQVNNASIERAWMLELNYPPLDQVDLYIVKGDREVIHSVSGDSIPFSHREVKNRNLAFELAIERGETVMVYLRVETEGAMALPIRLVHTVQYAQQEQLTYLLLGTYYGLMLIMVIYNGIMAFSFRSRVYFSYVWINLSNLFLYTTLNGIAFEYVWPDGVWWNNRAIVFFMCLSHLAALLFTSEYLDVKRRSPGLYRIFQWFALLEVVNLLVLLVNYPAGLIISIYSVPAIQLSLILAGVWGLKNGYRPARYFLLGWGVFMIGAMLSTLSDAGYIPIVWWTTYASQIGSTFEAVVLSWGLAYQIQTIRKEKEIAIALMKETRRLADLDDLTGLYNRRYVISAFEEAAGMEGNHPISLLMLDLDHFKKVNDTFGHDVGDLVLQQLASVLEECFRPTDTIGRFGGEEFMVLLKNTNVEQARSASEYVLKSIREMRFAVRDQMLACTVSIGVAEWDGAGEESFKEMLRRADQALYEAKHRGRNQVCVSGRPWREEA